MIDFFGYTSKDFLFEMFEFTVGEVTEVLRYMSLLKEIDSCKQENLEKYIFLYGDDQEIYNNAERRFIESIGDIYISNEFYKRTKHRDIPCRVISVKIETYEPIKDAVFFMKEINKAVGGYTIFFINVSEKFYIGTTLFSQNVKMDCLLSNPILTYEDMEGICDELRFACDCEEFIDYYSAVVLAIKYRNKKSEDYDTRVKRRCGIQYSYLQMLSDVEKIYGISLSRERERYYEEFEEKSDENFSQLLKDACLELDFIESFKANTMELLFEAEEMARLALRREEEERLLIYNNEKGTKKEYGLGIKKYLNDPELVIKVLKQKKEI